MGFTGGHALHGLVVGMEVGVIVDLQCGRIQSCRDLKIVRYKAQFNGQNGKLTFARIASSRGVVELIVES